jgi:hypothetical protein
MPAAFDPEQYTMVPTRGVGATLGLARALLSAAPSRLPVSLALRLVRLREQAEGLQLAWLDADRPATATDLRRLDTALDRRWAAVRGRLEACVLLDDGDLSLRAQALLGILFPKGLDFVKLPYPEEWAQSERRLALIKAKALEATLERLCGEPYLPRLQQAHAAYGEALGITKKPASAEARVLAPLEDLRAALVGYARAVIDATNEYDPDSVAGAQQLLAPFLRARRVVALGEGSAEEPSEPADAPLPELPPAVLAIAEGAADRA